MTIATETTNPAPALEQPTGPAADDTSVHAPAPVPAPASEAARRFAVDAARVAANTRCANVVVLDVSRVSPVTDFFVIATGTSGRQMRSVADDIEEAGAGQNFKAMGRHGHQGESWILTDFVDVIVHLFSPDARGYYDLDGLWGDGVVVDWQTGAPPPPNAPARQADDDREDDEPPVAEFDDEDDDDLTDDADDDEEFDAEDDE